MSKMEYFRRAESWAEDNREGLARSRRIAWIVAGAAVAVALLEALALAMLAPLKTVQPITLLVDRQTGHVQAIDPVSPRRVVADEALTQSFLAQYISAREGFDRATVSADYRRVALWSAGRARSAYLAQMPAANPASPLNLYPAGTIVGVRVKSVSHLSKGTALVRFDTFRQDLAGRADVGQPWISVVRYRYVDAPMQMQDRLVNPLGFQVIGYRRNAEAPPPAVADPAMVPPPVSTRTVG
ncbi:MAG: type IV secretion system protein [Sphingosinicella sp.]|nr:type IV secretion system protein [Sphingosinicella sp.]